MAGGLAHRLAGRLRERVRGPLVPLDQRRRQRHHQQAGGPERQQRAVPADVRQQPLGCRQHRELAERARGGRDAERHAALLGGELASEHAGDDAEGHPGQAQADQDAAAQHHHQRRRRMGHRDQAQHIEERADDHDRGRCRGGRRACPVNGCVAPQTRFCTAIASANVSRPQPRSALIGCRKRPKPCRIPIARVRISPPQTSTAVGVRQSACLPLKPAVLRSSGADRAAELSAVPGQSPDRRSPACGRGPSPGGSCPRPPDRPRPSSRR